MQGSARFYDLLSCQLEGETLYIAEVGAEEGPDPRWRFWDPLCFFYTFNCEKKWEYPSKNFAYGLWSYKCRQTLHVANSPSASSLFKSNQHVLANFDIQKALQTETHKPIELNTLDATFAQQTLDFIKIDAEGAELEILKGGQATLIHQCLAIQVKTLFCPIRHNVPTFGDIDFFIRQFDFELFHLNREHWIRANNISTYDSAPQLIGAETLYLLNKKAFLKRLEQSASPHQLFAKYILILLAHHLYDYAFEICEEVTLEGATPLKEALRTLKFSKKDLFSLLASLSLGAGKYLLALPKSKSRRRRYLQRKVRQLGRACLYLSKNQFALHD